MRSNGANRRLGGLLPAKKQQALELIEGWLSPHAQILTQQIFDWQRETNTITGILELGVFKGKYLSLLAHLASGADVPIVGVDAFLRGHGDLLNDSEEALARREIAKSIKSVAGGRAKATIIRGYTRDIGIQELKSRCPSGYSFISIDAGHDADDVELDAGIAEKLLSDQGVVAFDDVYNGQTPGVAEGVMRYFSAGKRDLAPFATCGNKLFVCRPGAHERFYNLSTQFGLKVREVAPMLSDTLIRIKSNEKIGWQPHLFGWTVIPFI